jgi:branched-chain amino acid transport system permease protein
MAGVAATLYMMKIGATTFNGGFVLGVKAFAAAVLGGIGNLRGALLGGLLLGIIENYSSGVIGSAWRDVTAFVLLVLVLLFRPSGLLGEALGRARA